MAKTCEMCGKEFKNLGAHQRMKHGPPIGQTVAPTVERDLENYHLPAGPAKNGTIRAVKMVAPVCEVCTDGIHARDWFNTCTHNPYFHAQEVPEIVEEREPQPDGTYIVTDRKTVHRVRQMPNLRQVPHSPRHLGVNPRRKFNSGWVLPQQIGVAPFCQALDCWSQDLPDKWQSEEGRGFYCSARHALPQLAQEVNVVLEAGNAPSARKKREEQMARLNFR